jgi:hypothetical protein
MKSLCRNILTRVVPCPALLPEQLEVVEEYLD